EDSRQAQAVAGTAVPQALRAPSPRWGEGWGEGVPDSRICNPSPARAIARSTSPYGRGEERKQKRFAYRFGSGGLPFCKSSTFIVMPFAMVTSPAFCPAAHGPVHFAVIVMCEAPFGAMPAGPPLRVELTSTS